MIRTQLRFHTPASVEEAVRLLGEHETAVLGGGTVLVPLMSRGERTCFNLIDLRRAGLDSIEDDSDGVVVGARTSYSSLASSPLCRARLPLLAEAASRITGGAQVRNRGTLAGSACYANPGSDAPTVLVALEARLRLQSASGTREIEAADFFRGAFTTALAPTELVSHIVLPYQRGAYAYEKVKFCEGSWPVVTAAVTVGADGERRLTLGGVCPRPVCVPHVALDSVEQQVGESLEPLWSDELAPGAYRGAMAPRLARRVLRASRKEQQRHEHVRDHP